MKGQKYGRREESSEIAKADSAKRSQENKLNLTKRKKKCLGNIVLICNETWEKGKKGTNKGKSEYREKLMYVLCIEWK